MVIEHVYRFVSMPSRGCLVADISVCINEQLAQHVSMEVMAISSLTMYYTVYKNIIVLVPTA